MSDEVGRTSGEAPEEAAPRRPSPTSRARRIGGRPLPAPRPEPVAVAESVPQAESVAEPAPPRPEPATPPAPLATAAKPPMPAREADGGAWQWLPAGALGVVVVVLIVLVAIASHGVYWAKADDSAGARNQRQEQVLAATKKCFATVNTYDYRKLGGLVGRDAACATGKFKTDLKNALRKTILPKAPRLKAVQTAQVNKAGIISVTDDGRQWTTLIYGQLTQSNSTTAKTSPRTDVFGAVVTVNQVGSKWLISKVDFDTGNGLGS